MRRRAVRRRRRAIQPLDFTSAASRKIPSNMTAAVAMTIEVKVMRILMKTPARRHLCRRTCFSLLPSNELFDLPSLSSFICVRTEF